MKRLLAALLLTACSTPPVQATSSTDPTLHAHPSSDPVPVAAPSLAPVVAITRTPRPTRSASRHRTRVNWDAVAGCESGGHWNHHTSLNGYWGGLQMGPPFWRDWGGLAYAARPDLATKAQQITVAVRAYAKRGLSPWPYCGRFG